MNKLKRIICIIIAVVMLSALASPVFAESYAETDEYYGDYEHDSEDLIYASYGESVTYEWLFWMFFAVIGIIAPIAFIVLGLALSASAKLGKPKYWCSLAIVGGIWLLIGIEIVATVLII